MIGCHHKPTARFRPGVAARHAALLVAVALSSAGCNHVSRDEITSGAPLDYRQRHPIAIREGDRTMQVFVGMRRGGLNPTQRNEVALFADTWRREATGGIIIDVPSGTPNARAAADAAHEVRAILGAAGVPAQSMVARGYRPSDPDQLATLRLKYPRMMAQAGPCGLWPEDLALTPDSQPTQNRPYWNLGCSSQRNLAAMVDNPADLVQPRAETPIYSARRSTALEKHRKGESPSTVYPDATKGTISDIGK